MKCPECGGYMRAPWTQKRDEDDFTAIVRYRKCRCGNALETREVADGGRQFPDLCPVCGAESWIKRSTSGKGWVLRERECTRCMARFSTTETVYRETVVVGRK
jgi:transcriptional regulator NrdR family protein